LKEWDKALDFANQARALHQKVGDQAAEAVTMNNVAAAYDGLGNWAEALSIYEQTLALRGELGDREGEAKTLQNMAIIHARHGNRAKAKSFLNRAMALARQAKARGLMNALRKTMSQLPRIRQQRGMPKSRMG
jgi:tetratricopeptide (TPR) repeat protein